MDFMQTTAVNHYYIVLSEPEQKHITLSK